MKVVTVALCGLFLFRRVCPMWSAIYNFNTSYKVNDVGCFRRFGLPSFTYRFALALVCQKTKGTGLFAKVFGRVGVLLLSRIRANSKQKHPKNNPMITSVKLLGNTISLVVNALPLVNEKGEKRYGRLRLSTGKMIDPAFWSDVTQRPLLDYSKKDDFKLEQEITSLASRMDSAYARAQAEGRLTPERVKEIYLELTGSRKAAPALMIPDIRLVEMIEQIEEKSTTATALTYEQFRKKVEGYDPKVKMSGLTDAWRDGFYRWIKKERGSAENTMWGHSKRLNKCINEARKRGMKVNIQPSHPFRLTTPQTDFLDWEDLRRIIEHEPSTADLQQIKTIVLMGSFTSIRLGDYASFFANIAVRNGVLCSQFKTQKTCGGKHVLVMPIILKPLADQLRKHGNPTIRFVSKPISDGIAELLKEVGIKKPTRISSHDLRRSFLSNFIGLGSFPDILLAKVFSGHQISGDRSVMHGYDQGDLASKQRTFLRILATVPLKDVAGIQML